MKKLLTLVLILSMCLVGFGLPAFAGESDEEKVLSTITLKDDFIPGSVFAVLKNQPSLDQLGKTYELSDFPEVACTSVVDTMTETRLLVQAKRYRDRWLDSGFELPEELAKTTPIDIEINEYRTILQLMLEDQTKEGVLLAIAALEKRDDIYFAGVDFMLYEDAAYPGEWNASVNDSTWNAPWSAIQAPDAWSITKGSADTLVAVLDTGIDSTHPDLAGNVNTALGANFITTESYPLTADPRGHGTHVAGIIGAKENNIGITGVNWNVTLVPIRVFNSAGTGSFAAFAHGIDWANGKGILISNYSGGGHQSSIGNMAAMQQAVGNYGGLLICAAGNGYGTDIDSNPYYPASLTNNNVTVVGNNSNANNLHASSNYGSATVDLFAPGASIVSTWPVGASPDNNYASKSGTSMSTPFVAGTVALIRSKYPSLTNAQVKSAILCGVDTYAAFSGKCVTGGRLNAYTSLYLAGNCYTLEASPSRVKNIQPGVPVAAFTPQMRVTSPSYHSELVVRAGGFFGEVKTSGLIATGDYAQAKRNGAVIAAYTVQIRGDVCADGCIDIDDVLAVRAEIFGTTSLIDVYSVAADVNCDDVIDIDDILAIRNHMFGIAQINQS